MTAVSAWSSLQHLIKAAQRQAQKLPSVGGAMILSVMGVCQMRSETVTGLSMTGLSMTGWNAMQTKLHLELNELSARC